jgi:hypothetical protein
MFFIELTLTLFFSEKIKKKKKKEVKWIDGSKVQRRKWRPKVKSSYLVTNQLKTR